MGEIIILLDPIGVPKERVKIQVKPIDSLSGKRIAFLHNGIDVSEEFFKTLRQELEQRFQFSGVIWRVKTNPTAPAEKAVTEEITSQADVAIVGVGS